MSFLGLFGEVGANHDGGDFRSGKVPRIAGRNRGALVVRWRRWRVVVVVAVLIAAACSNGDGTTLDVDDTPTTRAVADEPSTTNSGKDSTTTSDAPSPTVDETTTTDGDTHDEPAATTTTDPEPVECFGEFVHVHPDLPLDVHVETEPHRECHQHLCDTAPHGPTFTYVGELYPCTEQTIVVVPDPTVTTPPSTTSVPAVDNTTTTTPTTPTTTTSPEPSSDFLVAQRIVEATECGVPFASPGEQFRLVAVGFAANSSVSFAVRAESFGGTELTAPTIPSVTADEDGLIDVLWTVPTAPAVSADAAPRLFLVEASGLNTDGGVHSAVPLTPLVAYPATPPCATADTAATTLGQSVNISVLGNDTAPTGGTLDATSMRILGTSDERFIVDQTTGVVSYTPPQGFYGRVVGSYVVYDTWGVGVRADITVTVASGCTITGKAEVTEITGTEGDDVICVPDPDDRWAFHVIYGLGGNDVIVGGAGTDWIYGGEGADVLFGGGGKDRILGGGGVDTIYGGHGVDHVYSLDLDDIIVDDDYEFLLTPKGGVPGLSKPVTSDDWVWVGVSGVVEVDVLGNDHDPNENLNPSSLTITRPPTVGIATVVTASDGRRVVKYTAAATGGTTTFGYQVCDTLRGCTDTDAEVTVLVGTTGCTIVGTDAGETLNGTVGDDVICARGGDDVVYGLGGDDIIVGGSGNDTLYGGDGKDTLFGGSGNDTLAGNRHDDRLYGGVGDDTIDGGGENDVIYGGAGEDTLDGQAHDDMIFGGYGDDMILGGDGDDVLWGNRGYDTLIGNAGADTLYGGLGNDSLDGGTQDDLLWGGTGDDTLNGRDHDDQLYGGPGNDTLNGGAGDDWVFGAADDDTLDGGDGVDHLDGGAAYEDDTCRNGETTTYCETERRL